MMYPGIGMDAGFVYNLFCDAIIVLAEDKEWANEVLPGLDASDFDLYNFDSILEFAQNFHYAYGFAPKVKNYRIAETEEVRYISEVLDGRSVTKERAAEVKTAIESWGSYRKLIKIWNTIGDAINYGVKDTAGLDNIIGKVKTIAAGIKRTATTTNTVEDKWI